MEQEKEKLERFISAVEATTNQQVRAIENDAENECANILAEAQKNAEEANQRYQENAFRKICAYDFQGRAGYEKAGPSLQGGAYQDAF